MSHINYLLIGIIIFTVVTSTKTFGASETSVLYLDGQVYAERSKNHDPELEKQAQVKYEKAETLLETKNWAGAIQELEELVQIFPKYKDAMTLLEQTRNLEAERRAELHYQEGMAQIRQKNYGLAYEQFDKALKKVPSFKDAQAQKQQALENAQNQVAMRRIKTPLSSIVPPLTPTKTSGAGEMSVLHLDGQAYVELPKNLFEHTTESTIEMWVKWDRFNKWARVFDFGQQNNAIVLQSDRLSNKLNFRIWDRTGKRHSIRAKETVELNRWYHIAVLTGRGGMEIYINGKRVGRNRFNGSFNELMDGQNYIGKSNWPNDELFAGYMSELRIWSTRRPISKIRFSINKTLSGRQDHLLAYYRFSEAHEGQIPNLVDPNTPAKLMGSAKLVNVPAIAQLLIPGELEKQAKAKYEKGKMLLEAESFADAHREFKDLVKIYPQYKDAQHLLTQAQHLEHKRQAQVKYSRAETFIDAKNWAGAIRELEDLVLILPEYKNAKRLLERMRNLEAERRAELHYQEGLAQIRQKNYRLAYEQFGKALQKISNFKDAQAQRQHAFENAQLRVAIHPFKTSLSNINTTLLHQELFETLSVKNTDFIKYIDQGIRERLYSQYENNSAVGHTQALAHPLPPRIAILGDIITVTVDKSKPYRQSKTAYTTKRSPEGKVIGRGPQETYFEITQQIRVNCTFNYQILEFQTGRVLYKKTFESDLSDRVEYAQYDGDIKKLVRDVERRPTGQWRVKSLRKNKFSARKKIKHAQLLLDEILKDSAKTIAYDVNQFVKSYSRKTR